jgi:hypothetical protein
MRSGRDRSSPHPTNLLAILFAEVQHGGALALLLLLLLLPAGASSSSSALPPPPATSGWGGAWTSLGRMRGGAALGSRRRLLPGQRSLRHLTTSNPAPFLIDAARAQLRRARSHDGGGGMHMRSRRDCSLVRGSS